MCAVGRIRFCRARGASAGIAPRLSARIFRPVSSTKSIYSATVIGGMELAGTPQIGISG
jgi:hypothetical protein